MHRVLIAGSSSFLGGMIARKLVTRGDDVHALIRDKTPRDRLPLEIPESNLHLTDGTSEALVAAIERASPDITYHLTGMYLRQPGTSQIVPMVESNFQFGIQLAEALCQRQKPVRMVNFCTYSQYYNAATPRPLDLYSALKQAYVGMLDYYTEAFDFKALSLILYDSYGIGDWRKKLIFALLEAVKNKTVLRLTDPEIVLDLIHIEDAADAAIHAADGLCTALAEFSNHASYGISGTRLTLGELVALFEDIAGYKINAQWGAYPLPERRIMEPWVGPSLPNWSAKIPLRDGLAELIETEKSEPEML
jgi:nucleoside-diphosphate-sugar epimerase